MNSDSSTRLLCSEIHHTHKENLMIFSTGFRVAHQAEEVIYRFCILYTLFLTLTTPHCPNSGEFKTWTTNKSGTNMGGS